MHQVQQEPLGSSSEHHHSRSCSPAAVPDKLPPSGCAHVSGSLLPSALFTLVQTHTAPSPAPKPPQSAALSPQSLSSPIAPPSLCLTCIPLGCFCITSGPPRPPDMCTAVPPPRVPFLVCRAGSITSSPGHPLQSGSLFPPAHTAPSHGCPAYRALAGLTGGSWGQAMTGLGQSLVTTCCGFQWLR